MRIAIDTVTTPVLRIWVVPFCSLERFGRYDQVGFTSQNRMIQHPRKEAIDIFQESDQPEDCSGHHLRL